MLDAIKNLAGGKSKRLDEQLDALEAALSRAQAEKVAITAMQQSLTARWAKLAPMAKSLEQVHEKAAAVSSRLDTIATRLERIDDRTKELSELDARIQALRDAATHAEESTQKALGPDGELHRHRELLQQLASQALQTQDSLDSLRREQATLDDVRGQLKATDTDIKQSIEQTGTVKAELDQLRGATTVLTQELAKGRDSSREARDYATEALTTIREVEKKLGPIAKLQEISQSTEQRLASLNALSEHVSQKIKALDNQQTVVEHAVVQANRVSEMVWAMDAQIAKITEGMKQVNQVNEAIARIESLNAETGQQLDRAERLRQDVERDTAGLKREADAVLSAVRSHVDTLGIRKHEFDAFDGRLQVLQHAVGDAETRMRTLSERDRHLADVSERADNLFKRFDTLFTRAEELAEKQAQLETLRDRLAHVDDLARKTTAQMESLAVSRKESRDAAPGHHGVPQVARGSREAGRHAQRRPFRCRSVRAADDRVPVAGHRALRTARQHQRQAAGGGVRQPEGRGPAGRHHRSRRPDDARARARAGGRRARGTAQHAEHLQRRSRREDPVAGRTRGRSRRLEGVVRRAGRETRRRPAPAR
ncbi:MAG: hypothetical protein QM736_22315 [Vicinamibacterales bacterium]